MAAAFDYGNLVTAGGGPRNYLRPPQGANAAAAALGNTQNWAGLAAATSASTAQRDAAMARAFADTASQGLGSYSQMASSILNAYGGIGQQGVASRANVRDAELAIEREKDRRKTDWRDIAGIGIGLSSLFIG